MLRARISEAFQRAGTSLRYRVEVLTQKPALKLAIRSDMVALADEDGIREVIDRYPRLSAVSIVDGPAWEITMLWSRERQPTPAQQGALDRLAGGFAEAAAVNRSGSLSRRRRPPAGGQA